ncbi:hypothetical protein LguiA_015668 [Lonicera macranthoides]
MASQGLVVMNSNYEQGTSQAASQVTVNAGWTRGSQVTCTQYTNGNFMIEYLALQHYQLTVSQLTKHHIPIVS